jgi:RecA/RadA recombinase
MKRGRVPTGVAAVDQLSGGGWPRAALNELAGGRSTGRTAFMLTLIAQTLRRDEAAALVDVGGTLDVEAALRVGMPLARLLWIRCGVTKALAAAETVPGAGNFGLVGQGAKRAEPD